jgi:hypothetical protein
MRCIWRALGSRKGSGHCLAPAHRTSHDLMQPALLHHQKNPWADTHFSPPPPPTPLPLRPDHGTYSSALGMLLINASKTPTSRGQSAAAKGGTVALPHKPQGGHGPLLVTAAAAQHFLQYSRRQQRALTGNRHWQSYASESQGHSKGPGSPAGVSSGGSRAAGASQVAPAGLGGARGAHGDCCPVGTWGPTRRWLGCQTGGRACQNPAKMPVHNVQTPSQLCS